MEACGWGVLTTTKDLLMLIAETLTRRSQIYYGKQKCERRSRRLWEMQRLLLQEKRRGGRE
jgi:hypothetical protein